MNLLGAALLLLWVSGQTTGGDVQQDSEVWTVQGNKVTMSCSHSKGPTYYQMYWYQQLPGKSMRLVVFTAAGKTKHDFGNFSAEKFSALKPDAQSGSFTVKDPQPADAGTYFCAVSARWCGVARSPNKNQSGGSKPAVPKTIKL